MHRRRERERERERGREKGGGERKQKRKIMNERKPKQRPPTPCVSQPIKQGRLHAQLVPN